MLQNITHEGKILAIILRSGFKIGLNNDSDTDSATGVGGGNRVFHAK